MPTWVKPHNNSIGGLIQNRPPVPLTHGPERGRQLKILPKAIPQLRLTLCFKITPSYAGHLVETVAFTITPRSLSRRQSRLTKQLCRLCREDEGLYNYSMEFYNFWKSSNYFLIFFIIIFLLLFFFKKK